MYYIYLNCIKISFLLSFLINVSRLHLLKNFPYIFLSACLSISSIQLISIAGFGMTPFCFHWFFLVEQMLLSMAVVYPCPWFQVEIDAYTFFFLFLFILLIGVFFWCQLKKCVSLLLHCHQDWHMVSFGILLSIVFVIVAYNIYYVSYYKYRQRSN